MNLDSLTQRKFAHLDDAEMAKLFERHKVHSQRLQAEAASVPADRASIHAEMKRRERELYS
jgi:uncharacterized protein (DUF2236 family)